MPDEIFALRDLINEQTGLFFRDDDGIEFIEGRLGPRLKQTGCRSFSEYIALLNDEGNARNEWLEIITELTINKSPFVRHHRCVSVLADVVVPEILKDNENKELRIWSAGCSTGEEPLMIAMALAETGWYERAAVEIKASDGSLTAIEKARVGLYDKRKVEIGIEPALREKYFTPAGEDWQVKRELQNRIEFSTANLANESEIADYATADVIFCQNVLIYFSDSGVKRMLGLFAKYMPAHGYLFSDEGEYFERLANETGLFERQSLEGVSLWKKAG